MNKISSRICSVFSRCRFWLNSAEKGFITGRAVSSHNCHEGWRMKSESRHSQGTSARNLPRPGYWGHLAPPAEAFPGAIGAAHKASLGQCTLPLPSLLPQSLEPRLCSHFYTVTTSTAPKFPLVLATSPTAGLKSSVGASDSSSWLQGMLRKQVSGNFCFFGVNAACPHESHNLGESQVQDGDANAVQLYNGTPTTFAGRVRD